MPKKKKLELKKMTVQNLTRMGQEQDKIRGGGTINCPSPIVSCPTFCGTCNTCRQCPNSRRGCSVNVQTCVKDGTICNPVDTYPVGGGVCP